MAWDQWMCFGGTEIINQSRTAQMLASGRGPAGIQCQSCAPCPDLDKALGYPGGYNPTANPWYDPAEPDSDDFAGLLITSVTGLNPGAITRTVTQLAGRGAVMGPAIQAAPQIVVTGILMAATCCAMEYGFEWLRSALQGDCNSTSGCAGADLTVLSCPVLFPDEDCPANLPVDYAGLLAPYYRTFKNAALVSGPEITQIIPRGCPTCYDCGLTEVTFTLSAADPCMYTDPVVVANDNAFVCLAECDITWVDGTVPGADCTSDDTCPTAVDCATDPNCVDTSPPSMPTVTNTCVSTCLPLLSCRACFDILPGTFPDNAEGTLVIDIFSGALPLRNVQVRVWENPLGLSADELDVCGLCSFLAISYIGPDSTLTIDGAARTATIACPGGATVRANPFIANGQTGSANFSYPSFAGCSQNQYLVCVTADPEIDISARVNASVVARFC